MLEPLTLTAKDAAKLLGISSVSFWKLKNKGTVKPLDHFTPPRYSRQEILKLARTTEN